VLQAFALEEGYDANFASILSREQAVDIFKEAAFDTGDVSGDIKMDKVGKAEMVNGTAKDRTISVNGTEMQHGRKTTSKCSDGYKAEIITGGENAAIVMAVEVDGANVSDEEHMPDLIDEIKNNGKQLISYMGTVHTVTGRK
jgi:hypothetical protein